MQQTNDDPVLVSARREALIVLAIWLAAMTYTVGYCYLYGYDRKIEDLRFVWGFPDWIFYGLILPWMVCLVISWVFAYVFMTDESLGPDTDAAETGDV